MKVFGQDRSDDPCIPEASMLAKVSSCAIVGLDGAPVDVEVDISNGQVGLTIVGLPDTTVQESRERVRAAIKNSNLFYPFNKRITML